MSDEPRKGGYIRQAWLVIVLAAVYGGALAGAQTALGPRIAENRRHETYQVIPTLVPIEGKPTIEPVTVDAEDGNKWLVYRVANNDGSQAGWILPAHGQGFMDRIDLLIGVTPDVSTITGLYVLDQKETPNLGSHIIETPFRGQFDKMPTEEPVVVVTGTPTMVNEIRAVTGATISSTSVADIVNRAIKNLKTPIQQFQEDKNK